MGDQLTQRRLVAVLIADIAGYTRLMEQDTDSTVAAWQTARREVIKPVIADHSGKIVKLTGDGFLVEFSTIQNAVNCAIVMQRGLAPSSLDFRIGINLGDIVDDGEDIHGEGVNIAARLEGLADPGGICISGDVYNQVRNRIETTFEDLGDQQVKNVATPVRVYAVRTDGSAAPSASAALAPTDKPSIAVLPFTNMSGDPEQEYFADGIAEDIITSLSKLSQLLVIARNSSFTYKGRAVKVQEIAKELGVRYVIEGSVRKVGDRVRITSQLIDCTTGGHLWAERFDRDLSDIFAVQDEVTQAIVSAMAVKLKEDQQVRLKTKGPNNLEAYDCFLRGREQYRLLSKAGSAQAEALLKRAIDLDPGYATAYAHLVYTHLSIYLNRWNETADRSLEQAYKLAQKSVALDEINPDAHLSLGLAHMWQRQHDRAIEEHERAIILDPNFASAYAVLGLTLHYTGRSEEAIELINRGMSLDPHYPDIRLHWLGQAYFQLGRYEEAIDFFNRRLIRKPDSDISRVWLAASYGHLGRKEKAEAEWVEALRVNSNYSLERHRQDLPYKDPADFEKIVDGLHNVGLPE
jgi:adenylate cyclase